MDFNLPAVMDGVEIAAWAAAIIAIVTLLQQISFVPLPAGSKARAWAVSAIAAAIVALEAIGLHSPDTLGTITASVLTWTALATAALKLHDAGAYTAQTATTGSADDSKPTLNTRGDGA